MQTADFRGRTGPRAQRNTFANYMPRVSPQTSSPETDDYVRKAYKAVKDGPRVGIIEERHDGVVPVHMDDNPPYAGVTEFEPVLTDNGIDVRSKRMGISNKIPTYVDIGKKRINYKERVAKHESRHVLSESLLKYMDGIPEKHTTLIMESYAEFAGIKGKAEDKEDILLTTPYTPAVKFGYFVDQFYKSQIDGKRGYEAFILDIQRYKSAGRAIANLGRNIRNAVANDVAVGEVAERAYRNDVVESLRRVGVSSKYLN